MKTYKKYNNKKYKYTRKNYKSNKTHKKRYGGRAIDAGSYGCVFNTAIKCADPSPFPYSSKNISKLMYKEDTDSELIEIAKVKKFIERIPNKENYFLISTTYQCKSNKLSADDLNGFDKKCRLFTKRDINSMNVNEQSNLNKLNLHTYVYCS